MNEPQGLRPWADPTSPGNRMRPHVRCIGCGNLGCTTAWGPWCFTCNVKRITRIDKAFKGIAKSYGL